MDYNKISALLEKYWEGESSLEEEALLRNFFSTPHHDLPDELQEAAPLFQYFHEEAEKVWEAPSAKVVKLSPLQHWMKYAAVLLMAIGIGYALKQHQHREKAVIVAMKAQDMEDPQKAYAETKRALQLLAKNLNKGTSKMQKLSYFNEATAVIEGKD
ncbi:hypothetical protein CLV51_10835 [Chitinophaga niastensis]|uniref:Uncharacterized protein n=1 Tax=Chitinophaga niastensis TaxID=536980 RepID=A0A2P8HAU5_CHINA|nr:hypothetical protein [Chitinophaga niastensis]PSL43346.1 hypothetical protein CLV51_10835 [Chitinophaga niastensis]